MDIVVEKLPKSRASIRVELSPSEMLPHLTAAAMRLSSRTAFPGFRPGKAPYDVVAKRLGEGAVWEEALEDAVRETFVKAVKDNALLTVGQPEIKVEKIAPGNPVIYSATVSLLPTVTLPTEGKLNVEKKIEPVTDENVAKTVEELRKMLAVETPVERPAQMGDRVEIDVDVAVDRVAIEGGKSRKQPAVLGEKTFIPGFEEQVVGMTKAQTKSFELSFPKEYYAKHLSNKVATFTVTLQSVAERKLPDIDDAFAERVAHAKNVEELRAQIRKNIESEHAEKAEREYEVKLLEAMVKKSTFGEIPELLVENELERMMAEIKYDIEQRGMKFEDYLTSLKKDETSFRKDMMPGAINRVKTTLIIRAVADAERIAVTEDEITHEISEAEASARDDAQHDRFKTEDFRHYVETVLVNRKAIDLIKGKQLTAS